MYTADMVVHHITALLQGQDLSQWRIGRGLIKNLGNPFQLGVEYLVVYRCSAEEAQQVVEFMLKEYGLNPCRWWCFPEAAPEEVVLYKKS